MLYLLLLCQDHCMKVQEQVRVEHTLLNNFHFIFTPFLKYLKVRLRFN